jgi:hypothetical protein
MLSLETLKVESPCQMRSDELDERRAAAVLRASPLYVHNLSDMSRDEAHALICKSAGRLCVAYVPSEAGAATTLEYHRPRRPIYRWRVVMVLGCNDRRHSGESSMPTQAGIPPTLRELKLKYLPALRELEGGAEWGYTLPPNGQFDIGFDEPGGTYSRGYSSEYDRWVIDDK